MYRYLLVAALAVPVAVSAGDLNVSGRVSVRDQNKSVDVVFTNNDKMMIQDYYRAHRMDDEYDGGGPGKHKHGKKVPPGLAKKGGLPPGLAKRQRLPDDVQYELLPRDLETRLAPLPANYVRIRVGQDFAILDKKTRVVLDTAIGL
ncbi:MAG: hypothetical protein ACJ8J7_08770 [Sulfurifustaceae bacterium]